MVYSVESVAFIERLFMLSTILLYVVIGVVALVVLIAKSPLAIVIKGWFGEFQIKTGLRLLLKKGPYRIVNNVLLDDGQGGTTQIDHIVLSPYGIFVVETKNMKGWIFGDEKARTWTQTIYRKKSTFQNPLRQNYKHIVCLSKTVKCPMEAFHHVVVFIGDAVIKTPEKLPASVAANGYQMIQYIKSFTEEILDMESVDEIARRIEAYRLENSRKNAKAHVAYLKNKHR